MLQYLTRCYNYVCDKINVLDAYRRRAVARLGDNINVLEAHRRRAAEYILGHITIASGLTYQNARDGWRAIQEVFTPRAGYDRLDNEEA